MECLLKCHLNNRKITFGSLCKRTDGDTTISILNAKKKGIHYRLEYSPLGNKIADPLVVLCGITPGYDSWQLFLSDIRKGTIPEKAAIKSVFSNMREKMFRCLDEIGLFEYLSLINDYWPKEQNSKKNAWDRIFTNESASNECGLQLTQACNCAILRNRNSEQPSESALNEIARSEPACLFNRLQVGPSTRLIIFWGLGRKLDNYWRNSHCYHSRPATLLLPHPSGKNRAFNNYDLFKPYDDNDTIQLRNAKASIQNGKKIITKLMQR